MSRLSRRELLNGSLPAVLAAYLDGPMVRRALAHVGGGKARWPKPSMEEFAESSGTGSSVQGRTLWNQRRWRCAVLAAVTSRSVDRVRDTTRNGPREAQGAGRLMCGWRATSHCRTNRTWPDAGWRLFHDRPSTGLSSRLTSRGSFVRWSDKLRRYLD